MGMLPLLALPTGADLGPPPKQRYTVVYDDFDELMDLPVDLLHVIYADAVATSPDPCARVAELCSASRSLAVGMCQSEAFWDTLNRRLYFYGEFGSLRAIPGHSSYNVTTAKNWFGRCCALAGDGQPKPEYATTGAPTWMIYAANLGKKMHQIAANLTSQLGVYVAEFEEAMEDRNDLDPRPDEPWASIFGEPYVYLDMNVWSDRPNNPYEWEILRDRFDDVLLDVKERPNHQSGSMITRPLGFALEIFQASYKLIKLLRSSTPVEFESYKGNVERMFNVLANANQRPDPAGDSTTWTKEYTPDDDWKEEDYIPSAVFVAQKLLLEWLSLPNLRLKYVYEEGTSDPSGSDPSTFSEKMGFFRRRVGVDGDALTVASSNDAEPTDDSDEDE